MSYTFIDHLVYDSKPLSLQVADFCLTPLRKALAGRKVSLLDIHQPSQGTPFLGNFSFHLFPYNPNRIEY
jgi:hypothetical protein